MGVNINWFKKYKLISASEPIHPWDKSEEYTLEALDGDSVSVAYSSRTAIVDSVLKSSGMLIPTIDNVYTTGTKEYLTSLLVPPDKMSIALDITINNKYILDDVRDRLIMLKEKSDAGYYITQDRS